MKNDFWTYTLNIKFSKQLHIIHISHYIFKNVFIVRHDLHGIFLLLVFCADLN